VGHVEETQAEQVERLIGELQDENEDVRWNATKALKQIGTPETLEAVKEYQSR
jgi:HEAT repeat protein|tara:strand:+ start:348 stop:506 length:159 start_codon:yes stop_codon:yes gene_type:complete